MTTLHELTVEHLGPEATEGDLAQFRDWTRELIERGDATTEQEAVDLLWGGGDYYANASRLGLTPPESCAD